MHFFAKIRLDSPLDRQWRRLGKLGGIVCATPFQIERGAVFAAREPIYEAGPLLEREVADLRTHQSVLLVSVGVQPVATPAAPTGRSKAPKTPDPLYDLLS